MISIIISTRNRAPQLEKSLESLHGLRHDQPFEVIVVNNGSTDHTAAVIAAFAAKAEFPAREVFEAVPGLANARNAGVRASTGEILVFTDDDCYVDPDFLTEIVRPYKWRDVGFVGGRISLYDPDDALMTIRLDERPETYLRNTFVPPGDIQGASMSFRRDVLEKIGYFDPLFGSGSFFPAEDFEAILRAAQAGYYGVYWPDSHIRHHHGRKKQEIPKLVKSYSIGKGAVFAKLLFTQRAFKMARQMAVWRMQRLSKNPRMIRWELYGFFSYIKQARKQNGNGKGSVTKMAVTAAEQKSRG